METTETLSEEIPWMLVGLLILIVVALLLWVVFNSDTGQSIARALLFDLTHFFYGPRVEY